MKEPALVFNIFENRAVYLKCLLDAQILFEKIYRCFRGSVCMSITDENQLFIREIRRLLDDYERSPLHKKEDIMEDILILGIAVVMNKRHRQAP